MWVDGWGSTMLIFWGLAPLRTTIPHKSINTLLSGPNSTWEQLLPYMSAMLPKGLSVFSTRCHAVTIVEGRGTALHANELVTTIPWYPMENLLDELRQSLNGGGDNACALWVQHKTPEVCCWVTTMTCNCWSKVFVTDWSSDRSLLSAQQLTFYHHLIWTLRPKRMIPLQQQKSHHDVGQYQVEERYRVDWCTVK